MSNVVTDPPMSVVEDIPHAPFVTFDHAPAFGTADGSIAVTLTASRYMPVNDRVDLKPVVIAHLRCTRAAAMRLRASLDRALLMAEPAGTKN